jgi:uncharacterized membrane protein YgcG
VKRPGLGVLAAVVAILALGGAAPATAATSDVSDFDFESFSGEYVLDIDSAGHSTMRVVETIVARFPDIDQNRGIIRAIPLRDGEVPLDLEMQSVTDENGDAVYFERNDYEGFAEFALGTDEFVHGEVTYVLEYTMKNTIRHFADSGGDEFYWDINGDGWQQSFDTVSASVVLSDDLNDALTGDAACFLGYYGEVGQCELTPTDDGYEVEIGPVGPYNTLTVAIGFDGGTVVAPELPRDSWIVQLAPKVLLGLAALLVLLAIVLRVMLWRDAPGRGTIIAQFEPPEDRSLLLDANLIGREGSALSAQMVDLAVRGLVNVIDTKPGEAVTNDKTRFELALITADGATGQELRLLVLLFGVSLTPGKRINPGSLDASSGASLYGMPATTAALAVSEGYRAEPKGQWPKTLARIGFVLVLAFIPIWIWAAIFDVLNGNVVGPAFATIALSIAVPIILIKPKRLTQKGAEAKEYLLGIREYLTVAEEDRMRMLQSPEGALRINPNDKGAIVKLNERLLGYAVLWGVEDQWAEKLRADYEGQVPSWLSGDSFDSSTLRSFTWASTSSVRPIVSSSSGGGSWSSSGGSSSSSGSSGGGFSGGGGGGGGGGGR